MKDLTLKHKEAVNLGVRSGERVGLGVAVAVGCMQVGCVHQWCWVSCGGGMVVIAVCFLLL